MTIDRDTLAYLCTPLYSIAVAMRLDIGTPDFSPTVEHRIAWVLTGILAGLTPIVGPVIAKGIQAAVGVSISKPEVK